jgi:transcriptional regulator with XRE-family HTH domain
MIDTNSIIEELRESRPEYDEAHAIVELVRSVGDTLERMRKRKGLSQAEMATLLGVTPGRVSQLESGTVRNAPSLSVLAQYARHCGEQIVIAPASEREMPAGRPCNISAATSAKIEENIVSLREEIRSLRMSMPREAMAVQKEEWAEPVPWLRRLRRRGKPRNLHYGSQPESDDLQADPAYGLPEPAADWAQAHDASAEQSVSAEDRLTAYLDASGAVIDARTLQGVEFAAMNVLEVAGRHYVKVSAAQHGKEGEVKLTFKLKQEDQAPAALAARSEKT